VPTPQDPEEEPVGDELPDERPDEHQGSGEGSGEGAGLPPADRSDGLSREDELWQAIVENYGERPQIEEIIVDVPPSPRDLTAAEEPSQDDSGDTIGEAAPADPDEHFVPPSPPPLPKPPPPRLLAWLGLFGVPTFVLVTLVAGISLPSWLGLLLMAWFVGGFVFLVVSMNPGPREGGDDGARI
jgi:hypothetical protein